MSMSLKSCFSFGMIIIQEHTTLASSTTKSTIKVDNVLVSSKDSSSMETVVLGPLRVWHVVFLVCLFILIIVIIVCCCFDIRLPRTRQQIEEGYQKRLDNSKYVKYLDNLPKNAVKLRWNKKGPSKSSVEEDTNALRVPKVKITKAGNLAVATPLAGHPSEALAELAKRKQFGAPKPRPGQKAMATAMQSVPKPQINAKTRPSANRS